MLFSLALALLASPSALADSSPYAKCVHRLHKLGGMALLEARRECFPDGLSEEAQVCQNRLFWFAGFSPSDALSGCKRAYDPTLYAACVARKVRDQGAWQAPSAEACLRNPGSDGNYAYPEPPAGRYGEIENAGPAKKTICSITVNSPDERDLFQKKLPAGEYQWIELLPEASEPGRFFARDEKWLDRFCESGIQCDTLVVSGHFAGTFLGDSGYDLELLPLWKRSCSRACPGLFGAKDVYLFGCNTLAGKNKDSRTVEGYVNILIEDGLDPAESQRVAAQRYTNYGVSFGERMQWVFPDAERIVGFPSLSPSGKNIRAPLGRFLDEVAQGGDAAFDSAFKQHIAPLGSKLARGKDDARREAFCSRSGDGEKVLESIPELLAGGVLPDPRDRTRAKKELLDYARERAAAVPVPAWDALRLAMALHLVTESEARDVGAQMVSSLRTLDAKTRRQRLCPLRSQGMASLPGFDFGECASLDWLP